jgi:hypothetical protein
MKQNEMKQNEITKLEMPESEMGLSGAIVDPVDLLSPDCRVVADKLFGSVTVAGVFFRVASSAGFWDRVGCYDLEEVCPGLLAVVVKQPPHELHEMWRKVEKTGGTAWFRARSTWQLCRPGRPVGLLAGLASGTCLEAGDELIDPMDVSDEFEGVVELGVTVADLWARFESQLDVVQDLADIALRYVGVQKVVLVRNHEVARPGHEMWYSVARGDYLDCVVLTKLQAALGCPEQVGMNHFPDGYCYLELIRPSSRLMVQSVLGGFPTLASLLRFADHLVDPSVCESALKFVSEGVAHVDGQGVGQSVWSVPNASDLVVGVQVQVGLTPEMPSLSHSSGEFMRFLAGRHKAVFAYSFGEKWGYGDVVKVTDSQTVEGLPRGITRDGYYEFEVVLDPVEPMCLVLPKGVYSRSEGVIVGSDVYSTYVHFSSRTAFTLLCSSPHSYDYITSRLPKGVVYASDVSRELQAKWNLKLNVLKLSKYQAGFVSSSVQLDWRGTEYKMLRDCSSLVVLTLPVAARESQLRLDVVDLHDPLDDWLACYENRVSTMLVDDSAVRVNLPDAVDWRTSVITKFRKRAADRDSVDIGFTVGMEVDHGLRVVSEHGCVAVVSRSEPTVKFYGFHKGDQVSWRVKGLCDSYCYDDGGDSDCDW